MICPSKHYASTLNAYHALLFRGLPVGFVSERMLARGDTGQVKLLICADAPRFDEPEAAGLKQFLAKGGRVLFVGENATRDAYDRPCKREFPGVRKIAAQDLAALRKEFSSELKQIGLSPALTDPDGGELIGVEFRKIGAKTRSGKPYDVFLLINDLRSTAKVKLPAPGVDLLTGKACDAVCALPSGGVALIAVPGK